MTQFNPNLYIDPNKWHSKSFNLNTNEIEDILKRTGFTFKLKN